MSRFDKKVLSLLLMCISFTYANNNGIINPSDISTLNQNPEIAKLAKSTVMLFENDNSCNGIAIGSSEFITARHCIYHAEGKYLYYNPGDAIEMYAYTDGKFQLQYVKIKSLKYRTDFHYKYFVSGGEDLAIVQLENKPLSQYVSEAKIIQNPKKLNYETGVEKLKS